MAKGIARVRTEVVERSALPALDAMRGSRKVVFGAFVSACCAVLAAVARGGLGWITDKGQSHVG